MLMKKSLKSRNLRLVSIMLVLLLSTSVWAKSRVLGTAKLLAGKMKIGWNLGNTLEVTWVLVAPIALLLRQP